MKKTILTSLLVLSSLACNASEVYPLRIESISLIPVSCLDGGAQTATVTLQVTGGTPGYSYAIDDQAPQENNEFTNVSEGQHTFTITDKSNDVRTATIVTGPTALTSVVVSQAPYCQDRYNLGVVSVVTEGGIAPIEQELLGADQTFFGSEGQFEPVIAGNYTVISSPSNAAPCGQTQITFEVVIPQASGNVTEDFINAKYCIPCTN